MHAVLFFSGENMSLLFETAVLIEAALQFEVDQNYMRSLLLFNTF